MKYTGAGFTIVELLIVVVVIAILAAITIISYNGITTQAYRTTIDSETSAMAKQLQLYVVKADSYPTSDSTLKPLIQQAGLWETARGTWNYLYCTNGKDFALLPKNEKIDNHSNEAVPQGEPWRIYTPQRGWYTIPYDSEALPDNTSIAHDLCTTAFPDRVWQRWFSAMS